MYIMGLIRYFIGVLLFITITFFSTINIYTSSKVKDRVLEEKLNIIDSKITKLKLELACKVNYKEIARINKY